MRNVKMKSQYSLLVDGNMAAAAHLITCRTIKSHKRHYVRLQRLITAKKIQFKNVVDVQMKPKKERKHHL